MDGWLLAIVTYFHCLVASALPVYPNKTVIFVVLTVALFVLEEWGTIWPDV